MVLEHRDRGTRFGFPSIEQFFAMQERRLEVVFPKDTDDDLVNDFVSVITSIVGRIYSRRKSRSCAGGLMTEWSREQALALSNCGRSDILRSTISPPVERRVERGDDEFLSSIDIEL